MPMGELLDTRSSDYRVFQLFTHYLSTFYPLISPGLRKSPPRETLSHRAGASADSSALGAEPVTLAQAIGTAKFTAPKGVTIKPPQLSAIVHYAVHCF